MLRVTFYSYKGGVGRSLSLLNVAALLAEHGKKVLAVDLDLEAPGLGLSGLTRPPSHGKLLGVSDFLFDRWASQDTGIDAYVYSAVGERFGDRFLLMPTGTRGGELARRIEEFYQDLQGDAAYASPLLLAEIERFVAPDYVFFDSRTGLADVAGVCTMELPELLVAVCGLNDQNVFGMERALDEMRVYWQEASRDVATLLVLSPVPRKDDLQRMGGSAPHSVSEVFESLQDNPLALEAALWPREPGRDDVLDQLRRLPELVRLKAPEQRMHFINNSALT